MPSKHETWMPLYIADYLGDTMHLTAEQHGAYLLLLMAAWKRGGHVPDDDAQLAAITRTGDRWQTHCAGIVRAFFTQCDGLLRHGRVEAELAVAMDHVTKRAAAGARGAAARWQKDGKRIANALPEHKQTDTPSPSPITSSLRSEVRPTPKSKQPDRPDDVAEQTWVDWLALRKAKKAPVTATVIKGARSEAAKAGMSLDAFMQVWCQRGSQGLQADWLKTTVKPYGGQQEHKHAAAARAIFDGVFDDE